MSTLVTVATEMALRSRRGLIVTCVTSFWTIGTVYMALLALIIFGTYDLSWRLFIVYAAMPIFIGDIIVFFLVPESARYLALANKHEEATKVANNIADVMGYRGSMIDVDEIHHNYSREIETVRMSKGKTAKETSVEAIQNIKHLYTKNLRQRTLALQLLWFCIAIAHGLCTWINALFVELKLDDVYLYLFYFALANIPGNIAAGIFMDFMGRKTLLTTSMLLASLSLLYFSWLVSLEFSSDLHIIVTSCLYHAFFVSASCAMYVLTSEMFPTSVRSTGVGMSAGSGRVAAMIVQYINGALVTRPALMLLVACVAMAVGSVSPWLTGIGDMTRMPLQDKSEVNTGQVEEILIMGKGKCTEALLESGHMT